jgi:hypothetical protein
VRPVKSVDEAVAATREMLVHLGRIIPKEYLVAKEIAGQFVNVVLARLNKLLAMLRDDISAVDRTYEFGVVTLGQPPLTELRSIREKLKYDPNTEAFHRAVGLMFTAQGLASRIVVSFHGVGAAFRGLLVVVAYFQVGDGAPTPLCDDVFRISYQDSQKEIQPRFEKWLEGCLIDGIARWRRTLV